MKTALTKAQAGFSLVELMVVVAIIGILASMSAGQVQKQIAKARQAEAKTNLATVYTAEKGFQAEWSSFTTDIAAAGAGFDGNMRYSIGFAANTLVPTAISGYTGPAVPPAIAFVNVGACPAAIGACTVIQTGGRNPANATGVMPDGNTFTVSSSAQIYAAIDDTWTINQAKIVSQTANGIQ